MSDNEIISSSSRALVVWQPPQSNGGHIRRALPFILVAASALCAYRGLPQLMPSATAHAVVDTVRHAPQPPLPIEPQPLKQTGPVVVSPPSPRVTPAPTPPPPVAFIPPPMIVVPQPAEPHLPAKQLPRAISPNPGHAVSMARPIMGPARGVPFQHFNGFLNRLPFRPNALRLPFMRH